MNARTGLVPFLQYLLVRAVVWFLNLFPIDANLRTGRLLGRLWWHVYRPSRERARTHLRLAYGSEMSPAAMDSLGRRVHEHWAMFAIEVLCALRLLDEWNWPRYVIPVNLRETFDILLKKKGVLLLTGHYGSFDLLGYVMSVIGFDVVAVMRPLDNKYLNDFLVRTRTRHGLELLDKFGASAEVEELLSRGAGIGFVADQNAGRKGIFVDFFGKPASTYKSIALLAMRFEVPVVIGYARRVGDRFEYEIGVQRVIHPREWRDRDDPLRWITQEYTSAIEAIVRRDPEQYLWIHRRWKSQPNGRPPRRKAAPVDSAAAPT